MNHSYPIFTAETQCQDCFKCVRGCPVKAIKVEAQHASVVSDLCIACGRCVEACPSGAKKIRDDLGRTKQLLRQSDPVYVSLAPSWVSEFKGLPAAKMIASLRKLGFAGVSETALGAELVSAEIARAFRERSENKVVISSACPVAVDFVRKYLPAFSESISPVLSPALAHAKWLHEHFAKTAPNSNIKVVFIGPCIAKKNEADAHPELIATAILYSDLKAWFQEAGIEPWKIETTEDDKFTLDEARDGVLYPMEGGMNETIQMRGGCEGTHFVSVSGFHAMRQALEGFTPRDVREPVFIETLACVGGCVHGPGTAHGAPGLLERLRVIRHADSVSAMTPATHAPLDIAATYPSAPISHEPINLQKIRQTLRLVGKHKPEDELNCGGCGYDTCKNFAIALIEGKAEPSMCISHLRQLAQKKSNAILRCIPAAVVIVDHTLHLIECNRRFAELSGEDSAAVFDTIPGMAGSDLRKLIPFTDIFEDVLRTGTELSHDTLRLNDRLLSINVFNIDPGQVVGAILFDVTGIECRREQIAARAREVIHKNLSTVQDIACMLGEHMAETEILLRSIADDYTESGANEE
ncbi:MAG: [Fe-Fe] hydrogenase large subunit C-terminal domain-containing protein [Thermoguttaceae bacterium]